MTKTPVSVHSAGWRTDRLSLSLEWYVTQFGVERHTADKIKDKLSERHPAQ